MLADTAAQAAVHQSHALGLMRQQHRAAAHDLCWLISGSNVSPRCNQPSPDSAWMQQQYPAAPPDLFAWEPAATHPQVAINHTQSCFSLDPGRTLPRWCSAAPEPCRWGASTVCSSSNQPQAWLSLNATKHPDVIAPDPCCWGSRHL